MNKLFAFPIIMIDGNREEEKEIERERLSSLINKIEDEDELEIIIGEAECIATDLISISDRWLPTDESYERAIKGKFDACQVTFLHSGSFIVPWPKKRFKEKLYEFINQPS